MRRSSEPSRLAIDASALVELLLRTGVGQRVERLVRGAQVVAPDVINPEVLQSLRRLERAGELAGERASTAASRLALSPIVRVPTTGILVGAWSLRFNLSAYDACYVALARALDCPLLTIDGPLQRAPSLGVAFLSVS